ncbi:MAG: ATP-binding cassette domain-containing protein [Anaerolineae bacterium]|nr:ATP-binding cassette domain-containing protein [Anaerolineae bacterium]
METVVSLENVVRCFGKLAAVQNLSLEIGTGEIFGLLGPNGAGKTTVINLITGLLRRDSGQIRVLGFDPQTQARQVRRQIGLVPQETNVYGDLSAMDNLWHHAALYCGNLDTAGGRIEELLRMMELWNRRNDLLRTYSGGMKRRLALARALLHDPQIILFDEPTLGVDVQGRHVLWEHMKTLKSQGKTFIVSTNDMNEAGALCDRLVIVDRGKAIALDTPEALCAGLGRDIITLQTTPDVIDPERLFAGLDVQAVTRPEPGWLRIETRNAETHIGEFVGRMSAQYRLESLRIARPTLDDVFLHHTGRALRE